MNEIELISLLDGLDRELDLYPFWAKFKKFAIEHPVKGIDQLTPGRQVLLIMWKASFENLHQDKDFSDVILSGDNINERVNRLKSSLISNFSREKLDDAYLQKFFKTMSDKLSFK